MKILVIDDSLIDRKLIINSLKKSDIDAEFLQAGDGEEGIKVLSQNVDDVKAIFLDWQMPKMDGIEFMKRIREVPEVSNIPIIMITASSSEEKKQTAYAANPDLSAYITKPYKPETLTKALKKALGNG